MTQQELDDYTTLKLTKADWLMLREEIIKTIRKAVAQRDWETMRQAQVLLEKIDEGLKWQI